MKYDLQQHIEQLVKQFRKGVDLSKLAEQVGVSKFRMRHTLRKELGDEYWIIINKILKRKRSKKTRKKMSESAKRRDATWAEKVITTKRQNGYFKFQGEQLKIWLVDHHPMRGKKHSKQAVANMKAGRRHFYDNGGVAGMLGKKHSTKTKEKLRNITKQMWKNGVFKYDKHNSKFWRSKLEISVYEEFLKHDPNTKHSVPLITPNKTYAYDIYVPSLNLMVEVNGDYWHLNPQKYNANYIDESRNVTAKDVWEADATKQYAALNANYKSIILWETTINNDGVQKSVQDVLQNHKS